MSAAFIHLGLVLVAQAAPLSVSDLLSNPDRLNGQPVTVTGTIGNFRANPLRRRGPMYTFDLSERSTSRSFLLAGVRTRTTIYVECASCCRRRPLLRTRSRTLRTRRSRPATNQRSLRAPRRRHRRPLGPSLTLRPARVHGVGEAVVLDPVLPAGIDLPIFLHF